MSLDLGELRASVVIDQGQVPRGLAAVKRKWQDFTRGMTSDAKRAGGDAGGALGSGMGASMPRGLTAVQRRVEAFWGRLRSGSAKAGEDAGERTSRGMVSRLAGGLRKGVGGLGKVIGGGASMLGTVALGGAGVLAGLGAAGVAALGAVGVAGAIAGTKVASGNEQAAISFETMLGSATKADKFLRELQKFAAETPFEFPELQSAASSLISAGINADKVIPIMRTLGDVTSGMGTGSEGVKRATIALQQMSAAGRITGEDLNQLRDAGIPVFDLLAKATGKSKEEVVKLAQSGKLGKKELGQMMEALESGKGLERFSGLMEKQSQSLSGMWSTLKDTLGQGLAGIMSNALPLLKDGLNGITSVAMGFFGWFAKNQESISTFFTVGGKSARTFGRIIAAVFQAFIGSTGDGTESVKNMAQWLEENQETIVSTFVNGGKGALGFAKTLATMAVSGLRAFAFLLDGQAESTALILGNFRAMAHAAALAFGWVPGVGDKLRAADEAMGKFQENTRTGMHKAANGARGLADGIEKNVLPAIDRGAEAMDKMGKKEIVKARQRDLVAKTARAIRELGTDADGSQLKLKKWKDRTDLSADAQARLKKRLDSARKGLRDQLGAMADAGAGQGKLTKAWEKGKDRLYAEFKQMGLSNKEAKKLAERYAGVKPKVQTTFTTPGLPKAKEDAGKYRSTIEGLKDEKNSISTSLGFSAGRNFNRVVKGKYVNMGAFASGGYTGPGRPDEPAGIVHRDEEVIKSSSRRKFERKFPGVLTYINRVGDLPPGHKDGGTVGQSVVSTFKSKGSAAGLKAEQQYGREFAAQIGDKHSVGMGYDYLREVAEKAVAAQKKVDADKAAASGSAGGGSFLGGRKPVPGGKRHSGYGWAAWAGDFPNPSGTKVGAWAAGKVIAVNRWNRSYGNHVRIDHGKWRTLYAHLSSIAVSRGATVKAGNVVGRVGSTGNSTGPHLHFEKYDRGGRLRPGWTLAYNGTNKDETVRTHEQERALRGRRGPTIGTVNLHTSDRARDAVGELEYALARIENGGPHE